MTSNDYIHINEAVKEHGKTRQTFYNYIHKGLIRTKKVNNKVYLNNSDVEQLMSGYIPDSIEVTQVMTTSEAEEQGYEDIIEAADITPLPQTSNKERNEAFSIILKDLARLHQQHYDLKDQIIEKIHHNKQDLLFDTKVLSQNAEQRVIIGITQKMQELYKQIPSLYTHILHMQLTTKKGLFRAGYASILLIHILITTYIL